MAYDDYEPRRTSDMGEDVLDYLYFNSGLASTAIVAVKGVVGDYAVYIGAVPGGPIRNGNRELHRRAWMQDAAIGRGSVVPPSAALLQVEVLTDVAFFLRILPNQPVKGTERR